MNSLISIIIPVRNGSNYISEALKNIKSQNANIEIIVVDDASNDDTSKIAEKFGCVILKHTICKGPTAAKNTALKVAKGNFIMFHDHDDVMNSGALLKMSEALQEDQKAFAVMAQMKDFFSPELSEAEKKKITIRADSYYGLFSGSVLIRREVFDIIGLFNESLKAGDNIDWNSRMSQNNLMIKRLNFISANRRIHNSNFGLSNKETEFKDYASILRSKLRNKNIKKP